MKKFSVNEATKRKPSAPRRQKGKQASDVGMNPQAKSSLRRKRKVGGPQKFQRRSPYPYTGVFVTEDEELYLTSDDDDCHYGFHEPELPRKPLKNYDLDYVLAKRVSRKKRKAFSSGHTQGDSFRKFQDQRLAKIPGKDLSVKQQQQQQLKKDVAEVNASTAAAAGGSGDRRTLSHGQKKQHQHKSPQPAEKVPIVLYKVNVFPEDHIAPSPSQLKIPPYVVKNLLGKLTETRQQQQQQQQNRNARMTSAVADAQQG